ncbi:tyrosine phosphatase family-domain-containing protein [Blyttiomyces helicus]|uniref:Tyrosine phosphatase family-domain-containing protein n=1 Tax=Blyttiomyces helicus TaxID=388810 RepID=A0A4P9VYI4_9FUNG|nr:tyrosine phosphatase family-domain-containing protein [Blyttiomyces helicus]|eukprot:RKO84332.1 tyrosine phosphatase family-domain-containing protein [Blyttiomyces helicus]
MQAPQHWIEAHLLSNEEKWGGNQQTDSRPFSDLRTKSRRLCLAGGGGIILKIPVKKRGSKDTRDPTPIFRDEDYSPQALVARWKLHTGEADGYSDAYMACLESGASAHAKILRYLIATGGTSPAVIHCSAGKDRTGVVVALLLKLCGVDDDLVVRDYAVSEHLLGYTDGDAEKVAEALIATFSGILDLDLLRKMMSSKYVPSPLSPTFLARPLILTNKPTNQQTPNPPRPQHMTSFLRKLTAKYGSVEKYFLSIGISPAEIDAAREALTEAPRPAVVGQGWERSLL